MMNKTMKRKTAAALCAVMLCGSVTPAAFAEVQLIVPGGDALSSMLMENSKKDEIVKELEKKANEVIEKLEPKADEIIEKLEPKKDKIVEQIEIKKDEIVEKLEPKKDEIIEQIETKKDEIVEKLEPKKDEIIEQIEIKKDEIVEKLEPKKDAVIEQIETTKQEITDKLTTNQPAIQTRQLQQVQPKQQIQQTFSLSRATGDPQEEYDGASITSITPASAADKNDGKIVGSVTFISTRNMVIKLYKTSGSYVTDVTIEHNDGSSKTGTFTFDELAAGEYFVEVWFAGDGYDGKSAQEILDDGIVVGVKETVVAGNVTAASAKGVNSSTSSSEDGEITGSVTFSGKRNAVVLVFDKDGNQAGMDIVGCNEDGSEKTAKFSVGSLKAGNYTVKFYLQGDINEGNHPEARIEDTVLIQFDQLSEFALDAAEANGKLTATISGAEGGRELEIKVILEETDKNNNKIRDTKYTKVVYGDGTVDLGTYANGTYYVFADYVSPQMNEKNESVTKRQNGPFVISADVDTETPDAPSILEITGSVTTTDTSITVSFEADPKFAVGVGIEGKNTDVEEVVKLEAGYSGYKFAGLEPDTYYVFVDYYEYFDGVTPYEETVSIGLPAVQIKASAEGGNNRVDVTITEAADERIKVSLLQGDEVKDAKTIAAGTKKAAFEGLAAGTYSVLVDYETEQEGSNAVLISNIPVTSARAGIDITSVVEGEKTLTVKGTAQADAQILVQAKPDGVQAEILTVGADGKFETTLSAKAGTYTEVSVYYVTDYNSIAYKTGSWTVKEPAAEPTITVDPVDNLSTTVVVKTGANLAVTLKTPDNTQTLESNGEGLVHFSLLHKYLEGEEFTVTVVYGSGSGKTVSKKIKVGGVSEYKDLEYGDYGEAVLRLTTRLNQLGYPIAPTKDYNSAVREAVRLFQIANGQEADGEAGDSMQTALYSVSAIRFGSGRYPTLVRGDKGLALIKTLQQRLKDLGYYTIKVDGIFGSGTQRAVRLFQSVNGLKETGIADNATQVLLYSSAAKPIGYGYTGDYSTLQRSSKYKSAVVTLQRRLRELGYYSGSIDGYFGSKTYRAVRNFQSRNGLKVTGIADALTQQLLYSSAAKKYNGSSSSSSSSSSSVGYRLLYWGCRGDEVKRLQNALIDAGYKKYVRSADGIYGQWTYDAVCAYQRDHGLTVDGIAGKKTQNKLFGTNY